VNRVEKQESIQEIKALVESNSAAVVVHYKGLTVAQIDVLRGQMRDCNAQIKVIKNSLAKLAVANTNSKDLSSLLTGPTAIVVSNDPVAVAKNLTKFAKENASLVLLGGMVDNQFVDKKAIAMLSEMPSKDELRAKIIGLINAPATKLVRLVSTPATQLARVVDAYSKK
jgi:large subunit ribosomal protein L10